MNYPELLSNSLTKGNASTVAEQIISMVTEGEVSPLEMHARLSFAEKVIKEVKDNSSYQDSLLNEAEEYGKTFTKNGCEFNIKESAVKYDYSNCNYHSYDKLQKDLDALNEEKKSIEKYLKSIPISGTTIVDEETGEIFKIYPPSKSSKTIVQVTIRK